MSILMTSRTLDHEAHQYDVSDSGLLIDVLMCVVMMLMLRM